MHDVFSTDFLGIHQLQSVMHAALQCRPIPHVPTNHRLCQSAHSTATVLSRFVSSSFESSRVESSQAVTALKLDSNFIAATQYAALITCATGNLNLYFLTV